MEQWLSGTEVMPSDVPMNSTPCRRGKKKQFNGIEWNHTHTGHMFEWFYLSSGQQEAGPRLSFWKHLDLLDDPRTLIQKNHFVQEPRL